MGKETLMEFSTREESGTLVFALSGDVKGWGGSHDFVEEARQRIARGAKRIIIDLGGVERMDSSGVGVLASIITSAENTGATLHFVEIPERIDRILVTVGVKRVMKVYPTLQDALKSL
jgi:anti-sigma B factor antagonist